MQLNENNYCIIMAGGFGTRFWPLSQQNNPKQFLDILGSGESMLQATFRRFEQLCPRENIFIVTGELYADKVRSQIPGLARRQVLCEPTRRNTAPCVAYAASIIASINPQANIIVSPSDHAIFGEHRFLEDLGMALKLVESHDWIITIGVEPTNPNTKYGYLQFSEKSSLPKMGNLHKVKTFTEKPPIEMARQFIASGEFLWNSGIFVWRLPVLRAAYEAYLPSIAEKFFTITPAITPAELDSIYAHSDAISIDFGIMEKATNVHVMSASFGWSDVETWDSLYNTCSKDANGNSFVNGNVFAYDTKNCVVNVSPNGIIVLQGLDGYIVTGNDEVVMICKRDQEERIVKFSSDVELFQLKSFKPKK